MLKITKQNLADALYYEFGEDIKKGGVIENEDGTECLILVNPNGEKAQIQYEKNDEFYYFEVLPDTVTTVVFSKS